MTYGIQDGMSKTVGQHVRKRDFSLPANYEKIKPVAPNSNKYIAFLEKAQLVKYLVYGLHCDSNDFFDKRHKVMASALEAFMGIFPMEQWTCRWFSEYLKSCSMLHESGGQQYVNEIFGGIG